MDTMRALRRKDTGVLVDRIFRQSGWRRGGSVGEHVKSADIELEDPIGGDLYQLRVKP